jgi:hypothetical protein
MKNMYFGDVGDFGKYGLLKKLSNQGLSIGVNWYLTKDEDHISDGKFIEYLNNEKRGSYRDCDSELYDYLKKLVESGQRDVSLIERFPRFNHMQFYNPLLNVEHITGLSERGRRERVELRKQWFDDSILCLKNCDLIFCDPDNGIMPFSVTLTKSTSVKYISQHEIESYFNSGFSLMIYNHRDRSKEESYIKRITDSVSGIECYTLLGLRFKRYNVRDYIFIHHEKHVETVSGAIEELLRSEWKEHFSVLYLGKSFY